MISLIVAMDKNRLIGKNNDLPWHLPADLKYFKEVTTGHKIIMGRKTFESIGKPLPGRENIILTSNPSYSVEGCTVYHSIEQCLDRIHSDQVAQFFVIGGSVVFQEFLPYVSRLYITEIEGEFDGDTYFPPLRKEEWVLKSVKEGVVDDKSRYPHRFAVYERKEN